MPPRRRILVLTYPGTAVREDACGGTEQVALQVMARAAHDPRFELHWIGAPGSAPLPGVTFEPWRGRAAALEHIAQWRPHLIHNLGVLDWRVADDVACPVLFSLHLARRLYPPGLFVHPPAHLHWHAVSSTQAHDYGPSLGAGMLDAGIIPNGVALAPLLALPRAAAPDHRAAPLLYLGRICKEKAPDAAIAMARAAGRRLNIVGAVAGFPSHRAYFADRIAPELDPDIAWIPAPSAAAKRDLLARAAAVVIPSRIEETSSLTAMEAAAAGVPVIARRIGALPEIVAEGKTGWLASTDAELARAAAHITALIATIRPEACRAHARRHFDGDRMARRYGDLYARLAAAPAGEPAPLQ